MMTFGMWGGCCSGIFGSLGWFGPILNLFIIVGVIIGFVWFLVWTVRRLSSGPNRFSSLTNQPGSGQTPLEMMNIRYAGGEITREEYQVMKKDLK